MSAIASNLQVVRRRIDAAARAAGRDPATVHLLAVSKTWPAGDVRDAALAGQRAFAESYVQEGVAKVAEVAELLSHPECRGLSARQLEWHFIGPVQSNKTRLVAEHFAWVHSIERARIAERLSAQRPVDLPPLQVCVQVNVSGEASKSGCDPDAAVELCRIVASLPNLRLRGLMAIPEPAEDEAAQRAPFRQMRELFETLRTEGLAMDTLSMGMSGDLEAAIAEGATMVRVGTAIFGERHYL